MSSVRLLCCSGRSFKNCLSLDLLTGLSHLDVSDYHSCHWILIPWNALDDLFTFFRRLTSILSLLLSYRRWILTSHDRPTQNDRTPLTALAIDHLDLYDLVTSTALFQSDRRYAPKVSCDLPACLPHRPTVHRDPAPSTRVARRLLRRSGRPSRRQTHPCCNHKHQNRPSKSLLRPARLVRSLQRFTVSNQRTWLVHHRDLRRLATQTDSCSRTSITMKSRHTCIPWRSVVCLVLPVQD